MCLSTAYKTSEPDSIIMEYVSKIEVEGNLITLTDVVGDTKTVEGTIKMVDLTGGVVKINCYGRVDLQAGIELAAQAVIDDGGDRCALGRSILLHSNTICSSDHLQ